MSPDLKKIKRAKVWFGSSVTKAEVVRKLFITSSFYNCNDTLSKGMPETHRGCAMETIEMKGKMSMKMPDDFVDMSRDESALCGAGGYVYDKWHSSSLPATLESNYTKTNVSKGFFRNTVTTETGVAFKFSNGVISHDIKKFNTSDELGLGVKFTAGLAVVGAAGVCIWQIVEACDKS